MDSIRGCGLTGMRIDKEELRQRLIMPKYLRIAIRNSIRFKDPNSVDENQPADDNPEHPEAPMVVFINSRSGGRHGPELKVRLHQLIAEEQVRMMWQLVG